MDKISILLCELMYRVLLDSLAQMAQMEKMVYQERKGNLVERADLETLYVNNNEMHIL